MFHLKTRVHFDEIEFVLLKQKLKCPDSPITDTTTRIGAAASHPVPQPRRNTESRRLLKNFLVPTLHRTVSLPQVNGIAMFVNQNLKLDMARIFQKFFCVNRGVAKRCLSFVSSYYDRIRQCGFGMHYAHSAPPTTS